jgi:hypothetical protein
MKTCPYCAEEIQEAAIKCKHCMEFLDGTSRSVPQLPQEEKPTWYFRVPFIVIALCSVGPFALPLIWWRPKTSQTWKLGSTVAVLLLTGLLCLALLKLFGLFQQYYELLQSF